jgi:hypothetical protein
MAGSIAKVEKNSVGTDSPAAWTADPHLLQAGRHREGFASFRGDIVENELRIGIVLDLNQDVPRPLA